MVNGRGQAEKSPKGLGKRRVPGRLNQTEALVINRFMDKITLENMKFGTSKYLGYEYFN